MDKHTPLPWSIEPKLNQAGKRASRGNEVLVVAAHGGPVAVLPKSVAELLVEAINSHASLLSTIKELMEALEMLQRQALQSELNTPSHEWGWEALQVTRTALSRAKSLMEQKP